MRPFRERLKEAAEYADIEYSQTAIAKSLGVSKQTVDRWMGEGEPRPAMIFHIADAWGVDARWLATDFGSITPPPGPHLPAPVAGIVTAYQRGTPQQRLSLRVIAKSIAKACVVGALALPFSSEKADAADISHNAIMLDARFGKIRVINELNTHMRSIMALVYTLFSFLSPA